MALCQNLLLENQIVGLVKRLDTLEGNVHLSSKHFESVMNDYYFEQFLITKYKNEFEFIKEYKLQRRTIDTNSLGRMLPSIYTNMYDPELDANAVSDCYLNYYNWYTVVQDSLASRATRLDISGANSDSLFQVFYFSNNSTIHQLIDQKCKRNFRKEFQILRIFEGSQFYLIIYQLSSYEQSHMQLKFELIFKELQR